MSRSSFGTRLAKTAQIVRSQPLLSVAVDERYTRFLATGDLPEDDRAAWAILQRALCARRSGRVTLQPPDGRLTGPPRELVFREAVHPYPTPRAMARQLIRFQVAQGLDPTDPEFVPSDCEQLEYGSFAMHYLGWPDQWVSPAYRGHMNRVMRQHARIREGLPYRSTWHDEAAQALARFLRHGEIPEDDDLRRYALTVAEMFAIHAQHFGHGGEELLDAFEGAAKASAEQRAAAQQHLGQVMARTGFHARP